MLAVRLIPITLIVLLTSLTSTSDVRAQELVCEDSLGHAATRETIEFQSAGRTVRGLIYRPRTPNGSGVVLLHGSRGLEADAPTFDPHAIQLASRGYYVLMPNYYDARPGEAVRSSQSLRIWRQAARDAAAFLDQQPGVETARVAQWGYSLGGFIAVEAAMEGGGASAAIGVSAGTDVGQPGRARRSLPVLLVHSRRDPVISPSSTRGWARQLRRRDAAVDVRQIEREGHGYSRAGWCDVFALTRSWLGQNLNVANLPESSPP